MNVDILAASSDYAFLGAREKPSIKADQDLGDYLCLLASWRPTKLGGGTITLWNWYTD